MTEAHRTTPVDMAALASCGTCAHRRLRRSGAALGFLIGALIGTIDAPPRPRLLWNASASAPIGLYRIHPPAALRPGDLVAARAPVAIRQLAATRGYLPAGVPLVKRIAAGPASLVCAIKSTILVDGRKVANRLTHDILSRPMPWWHGCRRLGPRNYLLLNPVSTSFDGRYFGPIDASAIIGKAVPLWLR